MAGCLIIKPRADIFKIHPNIFQVGGALRALWWAVLTGCVVSPQGRGLRSARGCR